MAKYTPGYLAVLIDVVEKISDALAKDPINSNLFAELSDFLDPNNGKDLPKGVFKKMNIVP